MHRWLVWNLLFPAQEWWKGHQTIRILKEMEAADRLSAPELREYQNRRVCEFIAYTFAHVPYVRDRMTEAGLVPADIRGPEDLRRLPVMTKADVRKHRAALRADTARNLHPFSTGGSTGEPLVFDLGKRRVASRVACRQRVDRWWGVSCGDRELAVWGSPIEITRQDWLRSIRDRLLATRLMSAYELSESTMTAHLDAIENGEYRQIFAYPSAMYTLCLHARKTGRNLRNAGVKVVFVTSEMLYPYQRELISEVLNCPVANGYGGRDSGFISHECPQGGMHLLTDTMVVEVLDASGQPARPGETGDIVVTDLYSEEAPFLRYVTGDVGALSDRRCPCGRSLPLLERLDGRSNDAVVTPDGRVMHGQSLIGLIMEIEGIERFRIIQKRVDCFHFQIVPNARFEAVREAQIRKTWQERLRSPLDITFEYVQSLPNERSGKFRHIVSELPGAPAGTRAAAAPAGMVHN